MTARASVLTLGGVCNLGRSLGQWFMTGLACLVLAPLVVVGRCHYQRAVAAQTIVAPHGRVRNTGSCARSWARRLARRRTARGSRLEPRHGLDVLVAALWSTWFGKTHFDRPMAHTSLVCYCATAGSCAA